MGRMKEMAITLEETPTCFLFEEIKRRFDQQLQPLMVTDDEIHSVITSMEIELINRMAQREGHELFED